MVRAIIEGRKTQTRRIVKPQPDAFVGRAPYKLTPKSPTPNGSVWMEDDGKCYEPIKCPYGYPGDKLWVRETWAKQLDGNYIYRADFPNGYKADFTATGNWNPSIHMHFAACRILLEITDVRVERLWQISQEDAIAEGIEPLFTAAEIAAHPELNIGRRTYKNYLWHGRSDAKRKYVDAWPNQYSGFLLPSESYFSLWASINGPESWDANPWVWVITFNRITP